MTIKSIQLGVQLSCLSSNLVGTTQVVSDSTSPMIAYGTNSGNINKSWTGTVSATTGTNYTNLSTLISFDGTQTSTLLSFVNVIGMKFTNLDTNGTSINWGGGTNATIGSVAFPCKPGGTMGFYDSVGLTVTSGSNDRIYYQTSSGTATGSITIFGS